MRDVPGNYRFPASLAGDEWALSGTWKVEREKIVAGGQRAALRLNFNARKVFLVLGTTGGKPVHVALRLNGEAVETMRAKTRLRAWSPSSATRCMKLIDQQSPKNGLLEIETDAPGWRLMRSRSASSYIWFGTNGFRSHTLRLAQLLQVILHRSCSVCGAVTMS